MVDFALAGNYITADKVGYDEANTRGTAVLSGTANAVGNWAEIISAANNTIASEWATVIINGEPTGGADSSELVNIALGAASSEEVIIPNLAGFTSTVSNYHNYFHYTFPFRIPAGVRISANCQSSDATRTNYVHLIRGQKPLNGLSGYNIVTAFGANTADSAGVTVNRGTVDTYDHGWVQIDPSTSIGIKGFVVSAHRAAPSWSNGMVTFEVGVGGSGSEVTIYGGHSIISTSNENAGQGCTAFIPVGIAAGERIAIRAKSKIANADFDLDYIVYGVS